MPDIIVKIIECSMRNCINNKYFSDVIAEARVRVSRTRVAWVIGEDTCHWAILDHTSSFVLFLWTNDFRVYTFTGVNLIDFSSINGWCKCCVHPYYYIKKTIWATIISFCFGMTKKVTDLKNYIIRMPCKNYWITQGTSKKSVSLM